MPRLCLVVRNAAGYCGSAVSHFLVERDLRPAFGAVPAGSPALQGGKFCLFLASIFPERRRVRETIIPAQAGIQRSVHRWGAWIAACAGMTAPSLTVAFACGFAARRKEVSTVGGNVLILAPREARLV